MRFARFVLFLTAISFAAFGVAFTLLPGTLPGFVDGGLELGIAAFLFVCLRREERVRAGLVAAALMLGALGLTHAVGLLLDGVLNWIVLLGTGMELAGAGLAALALRSVPDVGQFHRGG